MDIYFHLILIFAAVFCVIAFFFHIATAADIEYWNTAVKLFTEFVDNYAAEFAGEYEWHLLWWYSRNQDEIEMIKTHWCRLFHKNDYETIRTGNQFCVACKKCKAKHFEFYDAKKQGIEP